MSLNKDIQYIKGVGEARAKVLNKLGIYTLEDLITYYPRDYEDRSKEKELCDVVDRRRSINKSKGCYSHASYKNKKQKNDNLQNNSK